MRSITYEVFLQELRAQGLPRIHLAFKCPICGTVQSMYSFLVAVDGDGFLVAGGAGDAIEGQIGFSCIGRWTAAGPFIQGKSKSGLGCDWTLGGLLHLHELEVIDQEGKPRMHFEIATPAEARALFERWYPCGEAGDH